MTLELSDLLEQLVGSVEKKSSTSDLKIEDLSFPEGLDQHYLYPNFESDMKELNLWLDMCFEHYKSSKPSSTFTFKIINNIVSSHIDKLIGIAHLIGFDSDKADFKEYLLNEVRKPQVEFKKKMNETKAG